MKSKFKKIGQLHCGACMENFDDIQILNDHIITCPAAIIMLPIIWKVWSGGDDIGHPMSHFIYNCHKNSHLIKRYAHAIADDMNSLERAKIHSELCEKLYLDYNKFRPFESSEIKKLPTRSDAEWILWEALGKSAEERVLNK